MAELKVISVELPEDEFGSFFRCYENFIKSSTEVLSVSFKGEIGLSEVAPNSYTAEYPDLDALAIAWVEEAWGGIDALDTLMETT